MKSKYNYLIICISLLSFFFVLPVSSLEKVTVVTPIVSLNNNKVEGADQPTEFSNTDSMTGESSSNLDEDTTSQNSDEVEPENPDSLTFSITNDDKESNSKFTRGIVPEVSIFNGDSTTSVTLEVPPGRAALQPVIKQSRVFFIKIMPNSSLGFMHFSC